MSKLWSKDLVKKFEEKWFSGLVTIDHLPDNKTAIKIKSGIQGVPSESVWGWSISRQYQKMFLPDKLEIDGKEVNTLDILPIKIKGSYELEDEKVVYNVVNNISTFKIAPKKIYNFEQIFDLFTDIEHTNKQDYESYLCIILSQIPLKFNWRIATTGGFGKSGLYKEMCNLLPNNSMLKLKSESKVMKEAHEKTSLVFDEFTDVPERVKRDMDSFFKISGDGANKIKNPAHGSSQYGTLDEYDTSLTSYGFFYNTFQDAMDKGMGDQYFDKIYDFPTRQRYFPVLLEGELLEGQFDVPLNSQQETFEGFERIYIDFIKSILYYVENPEEMEKGKEHWKWKNNRLNSLDAQRLKSNLKKMLIGVKACSKTELQYNQRCNYLWNSYIKYTQQFVLDPEHQLNKPKDWSDLSKITKHL